MDSGTLEESGNGLYSTVRVRWNENSKVYTRRVRKISQNTSTNHDSAPTAANPTPSTTSTGENPPAGAAAVPFSTLTAAATSEAPTATSEAPTATSAKDPNEPSSASSLAVVITGPTAIISDHRNSSDNVVKEFPETTAGADVNSSLRKLKVQYPRQERASSPTLVSKNADSSQEGQPPRQEHMPMGEASDSQAAEPQSDRELLSLPSGNNLVSSNDSSALGSADEWRSEHGLESPRKSSLQPSMNDLPNSREAPMARLPSGYELQNGGIGAVSTPLPTGNEPVTVNGNLKPLVITRVGDRVRFNVSEVTPRDEIRELKKKLESELGRVRMLIRQLEAKDVELSSYDANINSSIISSSNILSGSAGADFGGYIQPRPRPQYVRDDGIEKRMLVRVNSEVASTRHLATRPMGIARVNSDVGVPRYVEPRTYSRQLSVAVMENNNMGGEYMEKEKRTPKANQYYRNSEFLLGKDRLPPESNKRLKTNNRRKIGSGFGFSMDKKMTQVFKNCNNLLQRLMKHKYGWVFNEPVNAKALGLRDYHEIIKHPMDLGTIKNKLSQNRYKSPREFAEDVRLVFRNAMTYNPKGQDVHTMAEQLLEIFEERWAVIETEYNPYWKYQMYQDVRKAHSQPHFTPPAFASGPVPASFPVHTPSASQMMTVDRSESVAAPMSLDPIVQRTNVGRTPVPKKPKAKDPYKRDMTYEEKQRLSKNLQTLPSEKLDGIIQIIKKRNTTLSQNDTEIEVDIDTVDAETLWELDRFVTNYKKSLSKNKRKAELALQARAGVHLTVPAMITMMPLTEVPVESGRVGKGPAPPSADGEKQGYDAKSSSSSSSSSDSGSSSSDSDSDSSSADGSDGH